MRQVVGLVLRTVLWAFAILVGGLTGASFVKVTGAFGTSTDGPGLAFMLGGLVVSGFVVACVVSAMETVFPVFRASRSRRSGLT